ncbi:leucine-rich repeat-containing protein 43-like isoform X2 [Lineus longissimus]|uniref:leucine-rich repeat-containing protein 43-like isoform X2 n=1 Tax=Lineus longissimus TaxID=88925 RepID=UPI002B4D4F36
MTQVMDTSAYSAFESQLKTLCLHEFPCGIGSWRDTTKVVIQKDAPKVRKDTDLVSSRFPITLKDYGVQFEKTEVLEEYTTSKYSPWNLDYSWSNEAKELREIAVKSPWLVDQKFILSYFKTLRIVNKGVCEVDKRLLNFSNLEELTLSANHLKLVNSRNLPPNLKVLELCANDISDLADLCVKAPPLEHLGLGYNNIANTDDYITGQIWPTLLSLDLSHNSLTDLMDIVRKLTTLPKLRNLILVGNPICLIPGYRGYVIDSLRKLQILDDIRISADEEHQFKGLARRREFILDEAKVRFAVDYIKNLPVPEEVKNPDEQPEWPLITRKYYIEYMFIEESAPSAEVLQLFGDDGEGSMKESMTHITEEGGMNQSYGSQQLGSMLDQQTVSVTNRTQSLDTLQTHLPGEAAGEDPTTEDAAIPKPTYQLAPVKSLALPYAEEIEMNWWKTVTRDNLLGLRDFFKQGMEFSVIEEKVLSYPADQVHESESVLSGKKGKGKEPKKEEKSAKSPGAKSKNKKAAKEPEKKDDKKKKKKDLDIEMHHMPAEYTTLVTFNIPTVDFNDGEYEYEQTYFHGEAELGGKSDVTDVKDDKHHKKDKGKEKKKPPSAHKKDQKKDTAKSPRADKKDGKGKGKGDDKKGVDGDEEENLPPPPLEVKISIKLQHWTTAMDSVKAEKERLDALTASELDAAPQLPQ